MSKIIAHVDMDAFFAAIEERDNPRWRGMPIVVGADPKGGRGRGVVSTASYAARAYGIRSAMPISAAWRNSEEARTHGKPAAIFLPVDGRRYGEASERIMAIVRRYAPTVEQASVDEAYADLSHQRSWVRAIAAARRLKDAIFRAEQLTCSIGIASTKLVAKIASDFKKPDGLTVVRPRDTSAFLAPLDIRKLPGIGPKTETALKQRGLTTVGAVQELTEADCYAMFGQWGLDLYSTVRGGGDDELITAWTPKSIGEQETFEEDTLDSTTIAPRLAAMCASVANQLRDDGFFAYRRVVLTVRFADFTTVTRSHALPGPTGSPDRLRIEALRLFLPFLDRRENPSRKRLRLVGIRIEELTP